MKPGAVPSNRIRCCPRSGRYFSRRRRTRCADVRLYAHERASVTARVFTRQEQAQNHVQVGNVGLSVRVMLDWLDRRLSGA